MTQHSEIPPGDSPRPTADSSWLLVRRAVEGEGEDRSIFANHYLPVVRSYLLARWSRGPLGSRVDDAVQDVFVECYRTGGVLQKASEDRDVAFRSFLFGVVRNVAKRYESELREQRQVRASTLFLNDLAGREADLSRAFDDAWASALMKQAGELQRQWARAKQGEAAETAKREIALLELRFQQGLPIREIARQWGMESQPVHRLYQKARKTFHECLRTVVRAQMINASTEGVDRECERLFRVTAD